ncbi:MAG TPA: hypothetical protein VJC13_00445 [Candidatus Paceibacterota bacterium]
MINKGKIILVALTVALAFSPILATAATNAELQAQINILLQKVQELQIQLAQLQGNKAPNISYIYPITGVRGAEVTIVGSGFTPTDSIKFSDLGTYMAHNYVNSTTLTLTIPSSLSNCNIIGTSCTGLVSLVGNGRYNIRVINNNGTSNAVEFTVIGVPNY